VFADSSKHRNAVEKSRRSRVYATLRFFTQTIRTKARHARIQAVGPQSRKRCAPAFGVAHLLSAAELRTAQSAALGSGIGEIHVRSQLFGNTPRSHEQRFAQCSRCRSATLLAHRHTLDRIIISHSNPILVQPDANFYPSPECYRKRLMQRVTPVQFRLFKLLFALSPPCPSFPTLRRSRRP
jgi:hypothetical protein